ncbi:E3 UBIQUITIN-PROTEIN LIGASE ATL42 [Salix purpurea]|uniref:E3 UBIQUITIN-PROTEIN LIGASE ATL42 n=1 Tax=Salix purpurea TaxID=77065 RepID=A0A9Q1A6G5_SALPP|nr:E3 UBIQUITIN-PROTEIN LIGASE ATL42 [Salix purpurea]
MVHLLSLTGLSPSVEREGRGNLLLKEKRSCEPLFAEINGDIITPLNPPLPPPPPLAQPNISRPNETPFRTSIAVIVAVLTTLFSVTFLLLLYAKHCKRGNGHSNGVVGYSITDPNLRAARKHSGIDRAVIESLPIFRFSSLRGQKEGTGMRSLPDKIRAYRKDILLIGNDVNNIDYSSAEHDPEFLDIESGKQGDGSAAVSPGFRRVPGRHSSAGERVSGWFQHKLGAVPAATSCRRSLDSSGSRKKNIESGSATVGCFDRGGHRKDGLLMTNDDKTRLEHRIIVSGGLHQRWSDVQPSDLLYLRSEMILSDSRRLSTSSASGPVNLQSGWGGDGRHHRNGTSGRSVINTRSVSEITGLNRFARRSSDNNNREGQVAGAVSRWLAWISSLSQPAVRSERTATSAS